MKYKVLGSFEADYAALTQGERELFRNAVEEINLAFAKRHGKAMPKWPSALRIKRVRSAKGVWELTWSFSGPDGRATFDFVHAGQEPILRWRRIGGHAIFKKP